LAGEARTKDAAFSLAEGLDASPAFSRAALRSLSENDDVVEFDIEVLFNSDPDPGPASLSPSSTPVSTGSGSAPLPTSEKIK
ncbi:MAG: hypothetical protein JJE39_05745, partial [Vicinamibacteria bacterium]|nr:hypothetical protein [Vicinamibacteria bacterium]